jgi:hypothetical protein
VNAMSRTQPTARARYAHLSSHRSECKFIQSSN